MAPAGRLTTPPAPALSTELLCGLIERAARSDFDAFEAQLRSSGYCARPVRLRGQIETCDGHGQRRVWSTSTEPDGVLRKACGNRREAVCPPCAERYRQDAYHLIAAGLRGGKGIPDTVTEHPAVFATLTAPSFGVVHTRPLGPDGHARRCRPRRDAHVCEHGVRMSCGAVHADVDSCLGEPICADCFDYQGAVVWNNLLGELWRRTTIYLPRVLARLAGMTQKQLRELVRVAYVKVAEYQRRGLVHLHLLARLDRAMPDYRAEQLRPPDARFTTQLLEDALRETIAEVSAPVPDELGGGRVGWGGELDVRQLRTGDERGEIAGYLAKYATKSTEQAGGLLHRIDVDRVDHAPVRAHVRQYMRTAFDLNTTAVERRDVASIGPANRRACRHDRRDLRLAACAHAFGYRGHCLTKSRRYSTTFKQLRADREAWVHAQILARSRDATQRALAAAEERVVRLEVDGIGHVTGSDRYYALAEHARARERRRIGRIECSGEPRTARQITRRATAGPPVRAGESREAVHDG